MFRSLRLAVLGVAFVASAAAAQDKLQIHGYLSQAYTRSDTGTYLGITQDGTADYRTAALQFRYAMTSNDEFVLQLSHRRLGQSPVTADEPDVAMDWVYYSRRFGDFNAKIGRIPIPAGIYNEIRDVGVLLPLYRAPYNFYFEGAYTSETVDGAVLRYEIAPASPWNAEVSAFGGTYQLTNRREVDGQYVPVEQRIKTSVGGEVWINTPFEDVRVGGGASYQDGESFGFGSTFEEWHGSFDGTTRWGTLRAEYRRTSFESLNYSGYYAYLGIHAYKGLTLHGQLDYGDLLWKAVPPGMEPIAIDYDRAKTVGLSYAFRPDIVAKGEYTRTKGYWSENPVLDPTVGDQPLEISYFIVSLSVSF